MPLSNSDYEKLFDEFELYIKDRGFRLASVLHLYYVYPNAVIASHKHRLFTAILPRYRNETELTIMVGIANKAKQHIMALDHADKCKLLIAIARGRTQSFRTYLADYKDGVVWRVNLEDGDIKRKYELRADERLKNELCNQ
jgi:hypothetical protein